MFPQKVLYEGGAATLRWVPISRLTGRPVRLTATPPATYTIEDLRRDEDNADRSIDSGNASLDAVDTTLSAAAGPSQSDPRRVTVLSAANISAGHYYLLSNASGDQEVVLVEDIGEAAATVLTLSAPLRHAYPSASPFQGIELAVTFNATDAADEDLLQDGAGPFLTTWTYTADGVPHVVGQETWLTRYSVVPPINEADLATFDPNLVKTARERYSIASAIRFATNRTVSDLGSRRIDADYYRSPNFAFAVGWGAIECLGRWTKDRDTADHAMQQYDKQLRSMATNLPPHGTVEIDRDENISPAGGSRKRRGFLARL